MDRLLAVNAARASRERLTMMQLYEELRGLGYAGGYDAVRRYAATWKQVQGSGTATAFVPLTIAPGEAYQFDWSHEVVLIDGVTVTVKVAHVRLCHSKMFFVRVQGHGTRFGRTMTATVQTGPDATETGAANGPVGTAGCGLRPHAAVVD